MKSLLLVVLCSLSAYAHPSVRADAPACDPSACKLENNCRCSTTVNPIDSTDNPAPQLIAITISESIVDTLYNTYLKPLFFERTNPGGGPIGVTFYIPHEYTDYTLVQDLYLRGYEIGDHSITKEPNQTYWRQATPKTLEDEFGGQKTIISYFANIPAEDIQGVRTPQLQIEGDVSFEAYVQSELSYDNSWPTLTSSRILPYTLDYASTQQCTAAVSCPTESHKGFWVAPITDIKGVNDTECNSLATCLVQGSAAEIGQWLTDQINVVRNENRAPITVRLDSYWFDSVQNSFEGFTQFLDNLKAYDDVYLVSVQDIINWTKNPVGVKDYVNPDYSDRWSDCLNVNCHLKNEKGDDRYMRSCLPCPDVYPWLGNPLGKAQK